jgi:hypothetical protein
LEITMEKRRWHQLRRTVQERRAHEAQRVAREAVQQVRHAELVRAQMR